MSVYLDASILVSCFAPDDLTERADRFLRGEIGAVVVSDIAAAEFSSAIARRVRTRQLSADEARSIFVDFDAWTAQVAERVDTTSADIATATALLRRLELTLRAPDAINIAIAQRIGSPLATFDVKMSACARMLGAAVAAL